jgi:hypothetical protein
MLLLKYKGLIKKIYFLFFHTDNLNPPQKVIGKIFLGFMAKTIDRNRENQKHILANGRC